MKFGGENAPLVTPLEGEGSGKFAARQLIDTLGNVLQRPQDAK